MNKFQFSETMEFLREINPFAGPFGTIKEEFPN